MKERIQPILTSQYVKDYYNKMVRKLEKDYSYFRWFDSDYSRFEFSQIKRTILKVFKDKEFGKVLEIGAGDGAWTKILLQKSQQLTALDISEEMIKKIKIKLPDISNLDFVCKDFLENNLESEQYDLIVLVHCFEYLPDKNKAIEQIHRLLKKGGYVLIVTKNPCALIFPKRKKKLLHSEQIDINLLKEKLEKQGFIVKKIFPAIFGRKLSWKLSRIVFDFLHRVCLSNFSWLIPFKKYLSESFLIFGWNKPENKDCLSCKYFNIDYCSKKKHIISNGFAIKRHSKYCKKFKEKNIYEKLGKTI